MPVARPRSGLGNRHALTPSLDPEPLSRRPRSGLGNRHALTPSVARDPQTRKTSTPRGTGFPCICCCSWSNRQAGPAPSSPKGRRHSGLDTAPATSATDRPSAPGPALPRGSVLEGRDFTSPEVCESMLPSSRRSDLLSTPRRWCSDFPGSCIRSSRRRYHPLEVLRVLQGMQGRR